MTSITSLIPRWTVGSTWWDGRHVSDHESSYTDQRTFQYCLEEVMKKEREVQWLAKLRSGQHGQKGGFWYKFPRNAIR